LDADHDRARASQKEIFIMPQNHQNLTRRNALSKIGIGAAAAGGATALIGSQSAAAAGADSGPMMVNVTHIHHAGLSKFRRAEDTRLQEQLWSELKATLSPEQLALALALDDVQCRCRDHETDDYVEDLARHFPAWAPAIRCVAWHVCERDMSGEPRTCCEHKWPDGQG
jgi:hypothetical protein